MTFNLSYKPINLLALAPSVALVLLALLPEVTLLVGLLALVVVGLTLLFNRDVVVLVEEEEEEEGFLPSFD